jgi:tetratricopeptide (TPR) repeat protein
MRLRLYPEDHPAVLSARNQMGVLELERGNMAAAEAQLRAVLEVRRRVLGTHVEVAGSLYNVATAVARQDRHADAVPLFVESLLIFRQTTPSSHPDLARPLTGLAFSHMRLGQPGEAEPLLREAVQVRSTALGQDHVDTLQAQWLLARCFAEQKRLDDAIPLLRELLGRLHVHHPDHRLTRDVRAALAALLEQQGDAAGAAEVRGR